MNVKIADYLDIRLNLTNGTYEPYRKPNNEPLYIDRNSNHPPVILKQLPLSINKRLSELAYNETVFNKNKDIYQESLKKSGFDTELTYTPTEKKDATIDAEQRKRKRNIIWYNLPYSKHVTTNIGKNFFKLLNRHFPKEHKLNKIFNKNTIKISYSCLKNFGSIISSHNKSLLKPKTESYTCNCRNKQECPLDNMCQTPNIIYKAEVSNNSNDEVKMYIGLTETAFKKRYSNHMTSFKHKSHSKRTELSKYVWELQDNNITPIVNWSIVKTIKSNASSNYCKLCLSEKCIILNNLSNKNMLNTRKEFISKCRHQNKLLLKSVKNDSND